MGRKRRVAVAAAAVVVLAVAVGIFVSGGDGVDVTTTPTSPSSTAPGSSSATTPLPAESSSSSTTSARFPGETVAVSASRGTDGMVVVYGQRLSGGGRRELFRYHDPGTGGWLEPPVPSPDGRFVAYATDRGVYARDLAAGTVRTVVSGEAMPPQIVEGGGNRYQLDVPPRWSIEAMNAAVTWEADVVVDGILGVGGPLVWSPDGRSLAFRQSSDHRRNFGVVELATGRYSPTADGEDLAWLPTGRQVVVFGADSEAGGRVQVSRPGDLSGADDISEKIPAGGDFRKVAVSPTGALLAVAWGPDAFSTTTRLALVDADGSGFRALPLEGVLLDMAFTDDGAALLTVEQRKGTSRLFRHPVDGVAARVVATLPGDLTGTQGMATTGSGTVAVVVDSYPPYGSGPFEGTLPDYRSRLLVLDTATGAIRFRSGVFDETTRPTPIVAPYVAAKTGPPVPAPPPPGATTTTTIDRTCWRSGSTGPYLYDVAAAGTDRAWATGGTIAITGDGGRTWTNACLPPDTIGRGPIRLLAAHGATGLAYVEGKALLRTDDGGSHWERSPLPTGTGVAALSLTDDRHGFVLSGALGGGQDRPPVLLRTDDAGRTWTALTSWPTAVTSVWWGGMTFADPDHGWVLGRIGNDSVLVVTTDGGATWTIRPIPNSVSRIAFADAIHGWATGTGHDGDVLVTVIFATSDGGITFTEQARIPSEVVWDLDIVDATHAYAVGAVGAGQPVLFATTDGTTWATLPMPGLAMTAIAFADPDHGFVSSQTGSCVYRTTDGGHTWAGTTLDPAITGAC